MLGAITLVRLGAGRDRDIRIHLFWVRCRSAQTDRTNEHHKSHMCLLHSSGAQTPSQTKQSVAEAYVGNSARSSCQKEEGTKKYLRMAVGDAVSRQNT